MKAVRRVLRWAVYAGLGLLAWMLGMVALDVPAELPSWRHIVGAALVACAGALWSKA